MEGGWISDRIYFYLQDDPGRGDDTGTQRLMLWDASAGTLRSACTTSELHALAALHRPHIGVVAWADARFAMSGPHSPVATTADAVYCFDLKQATVEIVDTPAHALHSPDRAKAVVVRDGNLHLFDRDSGSLLQCTSDACVGVHYALPPLSGWNPLADAKAGQPVGLWTADSRWFLTHRIDEREVPWAQLEQQFEDGSSALRLFRRARPGDPIANATYVALDAVTGEVRPFGDLPIAVPSASPIRLGQLWLGRDNVAWAVRIDRYARRAELHRLDAGTGSSRHIFTESVESGYLELHPLIGGLPNVRILEDRQEFIWYSERDGRAHLYLHDLQTGQCKHPITMGSYRVRDIVHVDETEGALMLLVAGLDARADPAHRALCRARLAGGALEILLDAAGDVHVMPRRETCGMPSGVSASGRYAIAHVGGVSDGNRVVCVDVAAGRVREISAVEPTSDAPRALHVRERAVDRTTVLHGTLFLPSDFDKTRRYPLIDYIYPGPQLAQQPQRCNAMTAALAMAVAELGFVVLMLDTRGTPVGDRAFHQAGYGALFEPQLADHARVVRNLQARHSFIEPGAVGIFGWSAGGAAAARAMLDYGDVFAVGVAACGNHDPDGYRASWSDKYRGPSPSGRDNLPNAALAARLSGKLLLIVGGMDDNVPPSQTLELSEALSREEREHVLLVLPRAGHDALLVEGTAQKRMCDHFVEHLGGAMRPRTPSPRFTPRQVARFRRLLGVEMQQ